MCTLNIQVKVEEDRSVICIFYQQNVWRQSARRQHQIIEVPCSHRSDRYDHLHHHCTVCYCMMMLARLDARCALTSMIRLSEHCEWLLLTYPVTNDNFIKLMTFFANDICSSDKLETDGTRIRMRFYLLLHRTLISGHFTTTATNHWILNIL